MNRVVSAVVSQFMHPRGTLGRLAGWEMALRSSNRRRNLWAVDLLDIQPSDRVLEIGFGPGIAIRAFAERATEGLVVGIDRSAVMLRQASRRNAAAVRSGRVDLRLGSVEELPPFHVPFDKVLAVNNFAFWNDRGVRLKEVAALMGTGGRIAIVSQPRCPGATADTTRQAAKEITEYLERAGFTDTRVETLDLKPPVACVLGTVPIRK